VGTFVKIGKVNAIDKVAAFHADCRMKPEAPAKQTALLRWRFRLV